MLFARISDQWNTINKYSSLRRSQLKDRGIALTSMPQGTRDNQYSTHLNRTMYSHQWLRSTTSGWNSRKPMNPFLSKSSHPWSTTSWLQMSTTKKDQNLRKDTPAILVLKCLASVKDPPCQKPTWCFPSHVIFGHLFPRAKQSSKLKTHQKHYFLCLPSLSQNTHFLGIS